MATIRIDKADLNQNDQERKHKNESKEKKKKTQNIPLHGVRRVSCPRGNVLSGGNREPMPQDIAMERDKNPRPWE